MIKSVGLLTRKDGMSHEQFMKHWVEVHAPLAHAVPGLVRYVQSHIVEERRRPDIPATDVEIDGIAELWYEDAAAMARAMASPEAKALHADGALFIGRIKSFTTVELEVVPRSRAVGRRAASFLATQPFVLRRRSAGIPCGRLDCRKCVMLPGPVSAR